MTIEFKIGDKVSAWGLFGEVSHIKEIHLDDYKTVLEFNILAKPLMVSFYSPGEIRVDYFHSDGKHSKWHKESTLKKVEK